MAAPGKLVRDELDRWGVLLASDARLPSVAGTVAGGGVRGSWWAHPKGRAIFRQLTALEDSADAVLTRLVNGKVTFVHRRLFAPLHAIGTGRRPWQVRGLSLVQRRLDRAVRAAGELAGPTAAGRLDVSPRQVADAGRTLEARLLLLATQKHTVTGAHQRVLSSWDHWRQRAGFDTSTDEAAGAVARFEAIGRDWAPRFGGSVCLPWQRPSTLAGRSRRPASGSRRG